MTLTLNNLVAMAWRSVENPREGATEVLSLGIPREALWPALALVVVLSILLGEMAMLLSPAPAEIGATLNPLAMGFVQLVSLVLTVFAVFWIGRSMGGTGSFEETILIIAWLQFVMICVQIAQIVALLFLPFLASLILIAQVVLFFWVLTNFVAVLHGFSSLILVFLMIVVSAFALSFGLVMILFTIGILTPAMVGA